MRQTTTATSASAPAIDLDDLFDSIPEEEEIDVDIHELLAENRQIAHIWGIDDVQQQRPDLDDDQAWARAPEPSRSGSTPITASPGTPSRSSPMSSTRKSRSGAGRAGSTSASRIPTATAKAK